MSPYPIRFPFKARYAQMPKGRERNTKQVHSVNMSACAQTCPERGFDLCVLIHGNRRRGRFVTLDFEGLIIYALKPCLHLPGMIEEWYARYQVNGRTAKINGRTRDRSHLISFLQPKTPAHPSCSRVCTQLY